MNLIIAVDKDWGIGKDDGLLCHLPGDLEYFKKMTLDKTVVMGRVTLESLPGSKGLPKRRNVVLTHDKNFRADNAEVVNSYTALDELISDIPAGDVFVIGGEQIYKALLPKCEICYVTKIDENFDADRFFVNLDENDDFRCEAVGDKREENGIGYRFYKYTRIR
ncbi:MAG: dihydrofolate reductase [Eubacterium sp.]|nr:dihydrofolate reductase [Eubacterium sp.]